MMRAYDDIYLDLAIKRMGEMLDYVTNDLGIDPDAYFKMFVKSRVSKSLEIGSPSMVAGKSGVELAKIVLEEEDQQTKFIEPSWNENRSEAYWAGCVLAYFEWYFNIPYKKIFESISVRTLMKMYPTYHEVDVEKTIEALERLLNKPKSKSIKELRVIKGLSQKQLAEVSGMSVSQLQRLEYGERKVENLTVKTAIKLANSLGVDIEELI